MHVHELNPKKSIITLSIFFIIIVVGFITLKNPWITYKQVPEQTLQMISEKGNCLYPYELASFVAGTDDNIVLIDIRDKFTYSRGHIPGAINISAYDLTRKEEIKQLKEFKDSGVSVVLYGDNQLQANGPWMLFRQIGYDNVKVLAGGYDYYKIHKDNLADTKNDNTYLKGTADFDYTKVAGSTVLTSTTKNPGAKKPVKVRRKKKQAAASGGC
jgi:rhodanese-related sulfurtransferase